MSATPPQLPRGPYSIACDISETVCDLVKDVFIPDLAGMARVVEEISIKSPLFGIDFYKIPKIWQGLLVALVIRKEFIGREALTCFEGEIEEMITPEMERRIRALISSMGDKTHFYRTGTPNETGWIKTPNFHRVIHISHILEAIYDEKTEQIIEARNSLLPDGFIQDLIAKTPM